MKKTRWWILSLVALLVLATGSVALAASPHAVTIERWVAAAGGGVSNAGGLSIGDTIGQTVVDVSVGNNQHLDAGYWGVSTPYKLYFPLDYKNEP